MLKQIKLLILKTVLIKFIKTIKKILNFFDKLRNKNAYFWAI